MKRFLLFFAILLLIPGVAFADETESTTTTKSVVENPDTGVENYFLTLGIASVVIAGSLYIINKNNVFKEI